MKFAVEAMTEGEHCEERKRSSEFTEKRCGWGGCVLGWMCTGRGGEGAEGRAERE